MRAWVWVFAILMVLTGVLRAEEDTGLTPPPMGPPAAGNHSTPPANNNPGNSLSNPVRTSPLPTTNNSTLPKVVAEQPKPDAGITVNPKPQPNPKPGNGTPTVAANNGNTGSTGTPGTTPGNTTQPNGGGNGNGNTAGNTNLTGVNVFDLAVNSSQEFDVNAGNNGTTSFQFPSGQGTIGIQIDKSGKVILTGVNGQCDLQCQLMPLPIAGTMSENQQLTITGVTKFIAKKTGNSIVISLRTIPDTISISYLDLTPPDQTKPKENYTFRFLMVGHPPILIANGQTIQLDQSRDGVVKRSDNNFLAVLSLEIYKQNNDAILIVGGSLLGYPASP